MRTDSPAAHIIRGWEFYLNFGTGSNIQCDDGFKVRICLHNDQLGLNIQYSRPTQTDDWMQHLSDGIDRI